MKEENKVEAKERKAVASKTNKHDTAQKPVVDASGRQRDDRGHFLPTPNGTGKCRQKEASLKKELDDNTVKIRIVKEEKPLPPKDFEGKLEDVKERTAISFIRSIIANKPKRIDIDGTRYYAADILVRFGVALKKECELNQKAETLIEAAHAALKGANEELAESKDFSEKMERSYDRLYWWKNFWKILATGLVIWTIFVNLLSVVSQYVHKNSSTEKSPVVEQNQTEEVTGE